MGLIDHVLYLGEKLFWVKTVKLHDLDSRYCKSAQQSINQSNFYRANIPGKAKLSGATATSVFNSKIEETVP